jgi:hypothetical protein
MINYVNTVWISCRNVGQCNNAVISSFIFVILLNNNLERFARVQILKVVIYFVDILSLLTEFFNFSYNACQRCSGTAKNELLF